MTRRLRTRLLTAGLAALALWVLFFDSHSVLRRISYARELGRLAEANATLTAENARLASSVARGLDDETVERVAREQYGMRRPGERVYRVDAGEE